MRVDELTTSRDTSKTALETHGGFYVDLIEPQPETVNVKDIARALSMTCRYGGHVNRYYSVAEHAVLVSQLLQRSSAARWSFAALHHDDHEAFLCDLPTPLKNIMGEAYDTIREGLDITIGKVLNVDPSWFHHERIQWADATALRIEADVLKFSRGLTRNWDRAWDRFNLHELPVDLIPPDWAPGLKPSRAEDLFLAEHLKLGGTL